MREAYVNIQKQLVENGEVQISSADPETRQMITCNKITKVAYNVQTTMESIEANRRRIQQNQNYYRRRQTLVEHSYGTIKRQWGNNYTMTKKSMKRAAADEGLIFTAYILRRILNLIGKETLKRFSIEFLISMTVFSASLEQFGHL